jgi:hypothetical protein
VKRITALMALGIFTLTAFAGCSLTDWRLRRSVVTQASTLTELQYQQVLGNLAMMSVDPDAMPTHVNLRDGSAQIQDNGSLSSASPYSLFPSAIGSRTVVAQWSMIPVTDDVELRLLRLTYRRALGFDEELELDLANDLAHELCNLVSNSDYLDLRSDPNVNVEVLKAAKLFEDLGKPWPGGEDPSRLLKPRTIDPELRWPRSMNDVFDVPPRGLKNLIVLALEADGLHLRVYDGEGNMKKWDETNLAGKELQIDALKKRLESLEKSRESTPNDRKLTADETKELKVLLEPIVSDVYPNPTNLHGDYFLENLELFEPTMHKLNNLASAFNQLNLGSTDNQLIYEDEIKPGFGRKLDVKFIKTWDTSIYVSQEKNGKFYQWSVSPVVRDARRQVKEFYEDFLEIRPGWFEVGPKKAVPHDACYVGRYKDQYAWVCAGGRKDLADFTIKIQNFATLIKDQTITTIPGGPRYSPSIPTR